MPKTLFIADDSPVILKSLKEIFSEMNGIDLIGTADSVEDTLACISKQVPDIIIIDYQFKKGTGIEIIRYIREQKLGTIIFVFTIYGYDEYREQCINEGADFFIKKIGETNILIEEIEKIIHK